MATTNFNRLDLTSGNLSYQWQGMASGDVGEAAAHTGTADRTVQVSGIFDGATVTFEGTLAGSNWFPLRDTMGATLTFTTGGLRAVLENAVWVRPTASGGGAGTALTAILNVRR